MGISEENVKDYIREAGGIPGNGTAVWAVRMPSMINMAVFGPVANLFDLKYNIIDVTKEGLMVIGVDELGRLRPEHIWFSKESVNGITVKKGLSAYSLEIATKSGTLKYRLGKVMMGSSFHKKNLERALEALKALNVA